MKTSSIILLAATTVSSVLASPVYEILSANNLPADTPIVNGITFKGPVVKGGPEMTFVGTAEEIYNKVIAINPNYVAEFGGDDTETTSGEVGEGQSKVQKRYPTFNCSWGSNIGNMNTCVEGLIYLRNLGTAWCGANPHSLSRVSCSNGCGMYLYAKTNNGIQVHCRDIANDINQITGRCGQTFTSTSGYSVTRANGAMDFAGHFTSLGGDNC